MYLCFQGHLGNFEMRDEDGLSRHAHMVDIQGEHMIDFAYLIKPHIAADLALPGIGHDYKLSTRAEFSRRS